MVVLLSNAGLHVPVMLLFEVVGNADSVSPLQIADTCVKLGVTTVSTVMVIVWVVAH